MDTLFSSPDAAGESTLNSAARPPLPGPSTPHQNALLTCSQSCGRGCELNLVPYQRSLSEHSPCTGKKQQST